MNLATRMNALRLERKESLQAVATAVGVSKAHIWELEKGRTGNPAMDLVKRLADHFGVSVSFLIDEDIDAPDADMDLARMFRQAKDLDQRDRETLDGLLQSLRGRPKDTE